MHGIFFRSFDTDFIGHVVSECYQHRIYDPFLRPGMTILEVGGNVGAVTLYLARFAKRLAVVEPCQAHLEILRHTIEYNKLRVVVVPKALAAEDWGHRWLNHVAGNTTSHSLVRGKDGGETVECLSMTTLLREVGFETVDFLKLDVEGAEFEIIEGESFKKEAHRIKSMLVECHSENGRSRFERALVEAGFMWRAIGGDGINTLYGAKRSE